MQLEPQTRVSPLEFVREKICADGLLAEEELAKAEEEFRKFLCLVAASNGPLAVIDPRVDSFWHTLILFTSQYRDFCDTEVGFFVDHQPRTSHTPVPTSAIFNFVDAYERAFGNVEDYWTQKLAPEIQQAIRDRAGNALTDFKWSGWPGRTESGALDCPSPTAPSWPRGSSR